MMTTTSAEATRRTTFICFAAAFAGLLFGFDTAVISGTIEPVRIQFGMDVAVEGWFVSSGLLGCIIGVLIAGLLSDKIGRRWVLLLASVSFLVSGIGCALSHSAGPLINYRLVGGIGVGVASVISPMYITEFAPAAIRGRMVAYYQLAITLGILLAYLSNASLLAWSATLETDHPFLAWIFRDEPWRGMFMVMAVPSVLFIALIARIPESPRWMISKGKLSGALAVLRKTQTAQGAKDQYATIVHASAARKGSRRSVWIKQMRIPLLIGVMLCVFQQFSGINAIIYYGPRIFSEAGLTGDSALQAQVIIGVVNVLFTIVAITKSDKLGRRSLLVIGLIGMIFSLLTVGICFHTGYTDSLLLLSMLVLFIGCFALSVGPITWVLINEIFPDDLRVRAVSICTFALWTSVFMVGQFFPWLLDRVGVAGVFWVFAGFSILNLLFCLRVLVETKGKTLEEIEEIYVGIH